MLFKWIATGPPSPTSNLLCQVSTSQLGSNLRRDRTRCDSYPFFSQVAPSSMHGFGMSTKLLYCTHV